jgi:hypothetical protein
MDERVTKKATPKYDALSFREAPRAAGSGQQERRYFEYIINRQPLSRLLDVSGRPGVFGWQEAKVEQSYALQLLLRERSALESGRVPLYICGECADLGCQCVAVRVSEDEECVVWSDFAYDDTNGRPVFVDPEAEATLVLPFASVRDLYFLREDYEAAVGRFSNGHRMRPRR